MKYILQILISFLLIIQTEANATPSNNIEKVLITMSNLSPTTLTAYNGIEANLENGISLFRFAQQIANPQTTQINNYGYIRVVMSSHLSILTEDYDNIGINYNGYIYIIAPSSNIINISETLLEYNPINDIGTEGSFAAHIRIPSQQIMGWYTIDNEHISAAMTPNPYYNPVMYQNQHIRSVNDSYQLAGFPSTHPAWLRFPWNQIIEINICANTSAAARKKRDINQKCDSIIKNITWSTFYQNQEKLINSYRANMSNLILSTPLIK